MRVARLLFLASAYLLCLLVPYLLIRTALFGELPPTNDLILLGALFLLFVWTLPIATA